MKFVDVKNDVAFHKIFGNANQTVVLISFLNAVLFQDGSNRVVSVTVENPYLYPPVPAGKTSILDLKVTDESGRKFIVEVQVADTEGFAKRVQYYVSKDYAAQIGRGEDYPRLKPTYLIGILDFNFTQNPNYFSIHQTMDTETGEHLLKDTKYFFIELPKFNKREDELVSILDKWTYFIKNAPNLDVIPSNVDDDGLKAAYLDADQQTWTKAERESYDAFWVYLTDLAQRELFVRKQSLQEGHKKGRKEGIQEGRQEGIQIGRKEGFEIGKQEVAIEFVRAMHRTGLPIAQIASISGKSEAEVAAILDGAENG